MPENKGEGIISIKAEMKEALAFFSELNANERQIQKRLLTAVGTGGKQYIRRRYKSVLNKRSGLLYKSIKTYVKRNNSDLVFTNTADSGKPTSKDGRTARYGFMLASGYTITPKDGRKTLTFQINGKWIRKHSVTVRPKDFVEGPLEVYMMSADVNDRLEKALEKQLEYWEKRAAASGGAK